MYTSIFQTTLRTSGLVRHWTVYVNRSLCAQAPQIDLNTSSVHRSNAGQWTLICSPCAKRYSLLLAVPQHVYECERAHSFADRETDVGGTPPPAFAYVGKRI